ncbi:MAG: preprotein translocase subunit SecG [Limisphaerales bacterium]
MLTFVIGLLTTILVLDCLFLILLVLIQLPKKEAGAGLAFGGGATDALFGAGSGTALTKITQYVTAIFFVLALSLSVLNAYQKKQGHGSLERALRQKSSKPAAVVAPPLLTTNLLENNFEGLTNKPVTNPAIKTNSKPVAVTNVPATPPK